MSVTLIAQIDIHDRQGYARYEQEFMAVFQQYDGHMIAVDEGVEVLEGSWSNTRTVVIGFPDEAAAKAWYHSDAYQAIAQHRLTASTGNVVLVHNLDN